MFSIRISFLSKSIPVALPLQGIKRRKLLAGKFTSNASKCSKYLRTVSPHVFFFFSTGQATLTNALPSWGNAKVDR